jgi:hypothetical protein
MMDVALISAAVESGKETMSVAILQSMRAQPTLLDTVPGLRDMTFNTTLTCKQLEPTAWSAERKATSVLRRVIRND